MLGVDASEPALELARRNAAANGLANVTFENADVFKHLGELAASGRQFDVVVLDPPKFARNRAAVPDAFKGYRRLAPARAEAARDRTGCWCRAAAPASSR